MIKKVAWFLFFALLAVSCLDEPDCYNLNNNVIGISFRKLADNKADTVAMVGVTIDGTDSVFYPFRLVTGVELPLNFYASESEISFQRLNRDAAITDRLLLAYRSQIQFVSEDCGERFLISNLEVLESDFDSIQVVNASPGNTTSTNLVVYRCPQTDLMRVGFRQLNMDEDSIGTLMDVFVDGILTDFSPDVLYPDDTANAFLLPLNPAATSARYDFDFTSGSGHVTMGYRTVETTRYNLCGTQLFFADLAVVDSDFDKVIVVKDSIQDPPVTNILLQRCPDTNLVRIAFREVAGEGAANVPVAVIGITADYTTETFYPNATVSSVTLPLNDQTDVTRFSIAFEEGVVDIELGYARNPVVYHDVCTGMQINTLQVISSGFISPPQVLDEEIRFPANTVNVAIVLD